MHLMGSMKIDPIGIERDRFMKNLTLRYSITQFTYWAASSGIASFATTYLLRRGVSSGVVGTLLALAGLCSCMTQPLLAAYADRSRGAALTKLILLLSLLCSGCLLVQMVPGLPITVVAVVYALGVWCSDAAVPLLNGLSVAYDNAGYPVNYGVARAFGAVATAVSSLVLGFVIARMGMVGMLLFLVAARFASILSFAGYPAISRAEPTEGRKGEHCSVLTFFSRYPIYCLSLLGIGFLGMFHAMTENYLIAIVTPLGGDSSNVGTALFISALAAAAAIFFFERICCVARDTALLKIAAIAFLIKAICFYLAKNILDIYLIQLLHVVTYGNLAPVQVYYAKARVRSSDMVKGQAFITAAYSLGCSAGNFAGGQLLKSGVREMLLAGIGMALAGTLLLFATADRKEKSRERM